MFFLLVSANYTIAQYSNKLINVTLDVTTNMIGRSETCDMMANMIG